MEHHDDGKTMVIELKKDDETAQNKEDDINLTHSSLFPVKPKKQPLFFNVTFLVGILLVLLIVAAFLLISTLNDTKTPAETSSPEDALTEDVNTPPEIPVNSFYVTGLAEAKPISGVSSKFALLAEADSLLAVASKNGNEKMYPASLTKIMTFLVAYDALSGQLDKQLTLTQDIRDQYPEASRVNIDAVGDMLTVEQCMYAMLLESDTDSVLMLVKETAGSESAFVERMNQKAAELNLTATHFANANGLHHKDHYSTPAEMAVIFAKALQNELFHTILTTHTYETHLGYYKTDGSYATYRMFFFNSTLVDRFQNNGIATELPNGLTVIGGKTGFTDEAKSCQAALAVDKDGKEYIAILGYASSAKACANDTAYLYRNYIK